jgi:hypothetical protein
MGWIDGFHNNTEMQVVTGKQRHLPFEAHILVSRLSSKGIKHTGTSQSRHSSLYLPGDEKETKVTNPMNQKFPSGISRISEKDDRLECGKNEMRGGIEAQHRSERGPEARLGELKNENKVTKAKQDPRVEEVGKLKEEIRQMATQQDSLVKDLAEVKDRPNKSPRPIHAPLKEALPRAPPKPVKNAGSLNVPDGTRANLTRESGGNVHADGAVDVTSSRQYQYQLQWARKKAADLADSSALWSSYRNKSENTPHSRNNWICYDFKNR